MATLPKWLASITIDSTNDRLSITQGGTQNADMDQAEYDTILEVCANLEAKLQAIDATFAVAVDLSAGSYGYAHITCTNSFAANWAGTDDALETLLGFAGTEAVTGSGPYKLAASKRHRYGWYPPVGGQWPADRYRIDAREQDTDAGGMVQYASSAEHRFREVTWSLLSYAQLEDGGSDSDGKGGSVNWTGCTLLDFWKWTRDRPFRFYGDAADGTVASPGTEATEFLTCRRLGDEWAPTQPDPGDYTYFDALIRIKIVGAN